MSDAPTIAEMREDDGWEPAVLGRRRPPLRADARLHLRIFYWRRRPTHSPRCRAYLSAGVRRVVGEWVKIEWRRPSPDERPVAIRLSRAAEQDGALHIRTDKTIEGGVFAVEGMPAMEIELREERPGVLVGELPATDPRAWETTS